MSSAIRMERQQVLQVADGLAQAGARILDFRVDHFDSLSDEQAARLEQLEDELGHMVVQLRARGVELIGAEAAEASCELAGAIEQGHAVLASIRDVRSGVQAAVALGELAVAILGQNAGGALSAIRELQQVAAGHGAATLSAGALAPV